MGSRKLDAYVAPMTIFVKSLAKPNSSKLDASVAPMTIFVRSLANLYYYAFHYQERGGGTRDSQSMGEEVRGVEHVGRCVMVDWHKPPPWSSCGLLTDPPNQAENCPH